MTSTVHVSCAVSQHQLDMSTDQRGLIKMAQPLPGLGTYNQMASFRNELAYNVNKTCLIPRIMELTTGKPRFLNWVTSYFKPYVHVQIARIIGTQRSFTAQHKITEVETLLKICVYFKKCTLRVVTLLLILARTLLFVLFWG